MPIPPIAEQRRIVEKLDELLSDLDASKSALEKALVKLKRYRQAILKKAFSGELVPQDPDDEPASALLERVKAQRQAAATRKGKTSCKAKPAEQEALL